MLEPDRELRIQKAQDANAQLIELADAFERGGLPTEIVGAGGLGTWDITGANPRITEIHAGSYIFMDAFHRALVPGFDPALTVLVDRDLAHRRHGGRRLRPQVDRHRPGRARAGRDAAARCASSTASTSSTRSTRR